MSKKTVASLGRKKIRDKLGVFIAEGVRFVNDIPAHVKIEQYVCTEGFISGNKFGFREGTDILVCDEKAFAKLTDTVSPQGILAVCTKTVYDIDECLGALSDDTVIILDGIRDPGNLGTIIRTADAADVGAVFLVNNTVDLYNPKVLRSTMGSVFNVPVIEVDTEIIYDLKNRGFLVAGTSSKAQTAYYEADFCGAVALVIGSEADGISEQILGLCDLQVCIPSSTDSLNAAVACGITVYECIRQRNK